nr:pollen-specific leucine-rich repeat extensin-like protein 3 [Penaeus vannamei]
MRETSGGERGPSPGKLHAGAVSQKKPSRGAVQQDDRSRRATVLRGGSCAPPPVRTSPIRELRGKKRRVGPCESREHRPRRVPSGPSKKSTSHQKKDLHHPLRSPPVKPAVFPSPGGTPLPFPLCITRAQHALRHEARQRPSITSLSRHLASTPLTRTRHLFHHSASPVTHHAPGPRHRRAGCCRFSDPLPVHRPSPPSPIPLHITPPVATSSPPRPSPPSNHASRHLHQPLLPASPSSTDPPVPLRRVLALQPVHLHTTPPTVTLQSPPPGPHPSCALRHRPSPPLRVTSITGRPAPSPPPRSYLTPFNQERERTVLDVDRHNTTASTTDDISSCCTLGSAGLMRLIDESFAVLLIELFAGGRDHQLRIPFA